MRRIGTPVARRQVLSHDRKGALSIARLRAFVGALVLAAAVLLFGASTGTLARSFALVAALVSIGWLVGAARIRRQARRAAPDFLEITERELVWMNAGVELRCPISNISSVHVDEERLVVIVERREQPPWVLEPHFGGLGAYDLAYTLLEARNQAEPFEASIPPRR